VITPNKTWSVGDPIGGGEINIADAKTKNAYGKACRNALIDSAARHVLSISTLTLRRDIISDLALDLYGETRYMLDNGIEPVHIMSALASVLVHMTEIHDSASQDAADLIEDAVMKSMSGAWPDG